MCVPGCVCVSYHYTFECFAIIYLSVTGADCARCLRGERFSHHEVLTELRVSQQTVSSVTAISQERTRLTLNL